MTTLSLQKFRSPLRYPGGKQKAIGTIAKVLPKNFAEYREPLAGGANVYFYVRTNHLAKKYWINDAFTELVSFWQIVQDYEQCHNLRAELKKLHDCFSSAAEIKKYFHQVKNETTEEKFRQAFLFFFFNRVTFSGTTRAGGFSEAASKQRFTLSSIDRLASMPEALSDTKITNLDFQEIINTPGKNVFLFLDPPYFKAERLYGRGGQLHSFEHERLCHLLKQTNHKFLITYDDCDEIRSLYKFANITKWQFQYGMNNCNLERTSKVGNELFISNY